ncbi:hypothetical protein CYMTET_56642 [Cymbomonas tetramitiformis]|uniref:Methyltransferase small domain-containing protein n=1 Tax=Cymbomonas tetramitiformis TaxID=36881 RepID=A0AAE0BBN9_9CHLO|nr:hypothetical protein CYMTET_56642 [Cymbomonas tetramitiformis]
MKLKQLQSFLEDLDVFDSPNIELEQYPTTPHLAAQALFTACSYGDIEDQSVVDLGCGCGVLSVASTLMGAGHVIGVDIDESALAIAQGNVEEFEDMHIDLVQCDIVNNMQQLSRLKADTVVMNPPFGTRCKGADIAFLKAGFAIASKAVYSLHKSSTRAHVLRVAETELGATKAEVVAEMRYDISASYKFHKEKSKDIAVDFLRFELPGREE